MLRRPTPAFVQTSVFFEAGKEGVRDEWVVAIVQRIPLCGMDFAEVSDDADGWHASPPSSQRKLGPTWLLPSTIGAGRNPGTPAFGKQRQNRSQLSLG
jgi:hypothetical protein